jgi:type VI secretion system secreted protein VgrG
VPSVLHNQDKLLAKLTTSFGDDVVLKSLTGREAISEPFEFRLVFSSKDSGIDPEKALGSKINIAFKSDAQERHIDGIITEFSQMATANKGDTYVTEYAAVVRPNLWLLTLDNDCVIFQNKTASDIINKVLKDGGVTDIDDKVKSCGKGEREYCVQYAESSFNFVSRLMEDEGIFYFFDHAENKHTMVLGDASDAHAEIPTGSKVEFFRGINSVCPLGRIFDTGMTTTVNTGGYSAADYNYTLSQTKLFSKLDTKWKGQTFYEYPGGFGKAKEGDDLSKLRVQLFEFNHCLLSAFSTAVSLTPGFLFQITDHHVDKFNKEYVVYDLEHFYDYAKSSGFIYKNRVRAFVKGTEFRPPRKTPKPRIHGTQTAVVTCPSGEEIFRNEHCCVKVHFHWDQLGKNDEKDSCWIRVAQLLAGSGWGGVFIPRIGQEVVVSFLEGDPDRPLIVGCVYNDYYMPAYSDKEASKSSLKTVSFKNDKGFNEVRFDDEKDKEEIYVHAQKDVYIDIKNSRKTEIEEGDETLDLFKGSRTVTLKASGDGPANHSLILKKGDQNVELTEGNLSYTITKGDSVIKLDKGDCSVTLGKGNMKYEVTGDYTLTVSGNLTIKADGDISIEAGKGIKLKSGQDTVAEAGTAFKIKGGTDFKAEAGTALTLKSGTDFKAEAGTAMSLKSSLDLKAEGQVSVKVAGAMVEVAGTGTAKVSAPMITIGGGMLKLG